jgi:hypothetical protein
MNKLKKPIVAADAMLVSPGKSSRLRDMRNSVLEAKAPAPLVQPKKQTTRDDKDLSPELTLARRLIDQRLAEIMATLPAGKQLSLFKIRFGVELDQIKTLPIKRVVAILKISHPQLNDPRGNMKQTVELTYNGKLV